MIHCTQEIPCNPCSAICPKGLIFVDPEDLRRLPAYLPVEKACGGCERCVAICPGLAITLVDSRKNPDLPIVSIPFEFDPELLRANGSATVLDTRGKVLGDVRVLDVLTPKFAGRTRILRVLAPREIASKIAGVRVQDPDAAEMLDPYVQHLDDDTIICRCERVTAQEIRQLIRAGHRDLNEIKAISRAGMGACGSKTCNALIRRLFREEGIPAAEIVDETRRPLFVEVPLGIFAGEIEG